MTANSSHYDYFETFPIFYINFCIWTFWFCCPSIGLPLLFGNYVIHSHSGSNPISTNKPNAIVHFKSACRAIQKKSKITSPHNIQMAILMTLSPLTKNMCFIYSNIDKIKQPRRCVSSVGAYLPYRHRTSSLPVGGQKLAPTGRPADHCPLGGMGWVVRWVAGGPLAGRHRAYYFILLPTSMLTDGPLHWLWPPTDDLKLPLCQIQPHRVCFQPSITGWIVAAGLLCANPPHDYQKSASRPLDVNEQPPLLPLYRHSPLGGQLHMTKEYL